MSDSDVRYINAKITEEAKIAVESIRSNYKPDMELQELYSLAIMEYLHAFYPSLEEEVGRTLENRKKARRGER